MLALAYLELALLYLSIYKVYPGFVHNDCKFDNILANNYNKSEPIIIDFNINSKPIKFVINEPLYYSLHDYDLSYIKDKIENMKLKNSKHKGLTNKEVNWFYDFHMLTHSLNHYSHMVNNLKHDFGKYLSKTFLLCKNNSPPFKCLDSRIITPYMPDISVLEEFVLSEYFRPWRQN